MYSVYNEQKLIPNIEFSKIEKKYNRAMYLRCTYVMMSKGHGLLKNFVWYESSKYSITNLAVTAPWCVKFDKNQVRWIDNLIKVIFCECDYLICWRLPIWISLYIHNDDMNTAYIEVERIRVLIFEAFLDVFHFADNSDWIVFFINLNLSKLPFISWQVSFTYMLFHDANDIISWASTFIVVIVAISENF